MSRIELERPLRAGALREIERSLVGKLKAHHLSDSFIERCLDDALQQGLVEYLRAVEDGVEVRDRGAFVVQAAFCRAVDELRREARQSASAATVAIQQGGGQQAEPASEEIAIEHVAVEQLREAIATLPDEERQALSLHYFEQLSDRRGAELLYCSERTFRRRLAKALRMLGQRLGVPAPEPGSELAIEIGLAAWVSLAGARVVPSGRILDQLIAAGEAVRGAATSLFDRGREAAARLLTSGGGEGIGAAASGPLGKTAAGVCAGALAACAVTGVIGPGIGAELGGGHPKSPAKRPVTEPRHSRAPAVSAPAAPRASALERSGSTAAAPSHAKPRHHSTASASQRRTTEATHEATSQFGVESAAPESSGYSSAPAESSAPSPSTSSSPSPTEIANEQFGP